MLLKAKIYISLVILILFSSCSENNTSSFDEFDLESSPSVIIQSSSSSNIESSSSYNDSTESSCSFNESSSSSNIESSSSYNDSTESSCSFNESLSSSNVKSSSSYIETVESSSSLNKSSSSENVKSSSSSEFIIELSSSTNLCSSSIKLELSSSSSDIIESSSSIKQSSSSIKIESSSSSLYESIDIHFKVQVNQNFDNLFDDDSNSMKDVNCVLRLPSSYSEEGKPTKLVMLAHGAGNKINGDETNYFGTYPKALLNAGYALFDANGSNNDYTDYADHMGSPRAIIAYKKAFEYIYNNYNVDSLIYLSGISMGGLTALNFANKYPELVRVCGLLNPITAMYNAAWLHPWYGIRTKIQIAKEFNFTDQSGATYEADKVVGYDPLLNMSEVIDSVRYNKFPSSIRIWHGMNDETALAENINELIDAMKMGGVNAEVINIEGQDHRTSQAMFNELIEWFDQF